MEAFIYIAVGEVLHWLASRLCCLAVCPSLPHTFLPYGQIGIGIPGGLEGASHITLYFISPFYFGGLGSVPSVPSASTAFLCSCNSIHDLASTLLSVDVNQLNFPCEEAAAALFSNISI